MAKQEKCRAYCAENYDTTGGSAVYYLTFGNESQRFKQREKFRKLQKSRNQYYRNGLDTKDLDLEIQNLIDEVDTLKKSEIKQESGEILPLQTVKDIPEFRGVKSKVGTPGDGSTFLLCASSGIGKSTLLVKLYEQYFKDNPKIIPILISPSCNIGLFDKLDKKVIKINKMNNDTIKLIKDLRKIQNLGKNPYHFLLMIDDIPNIRYSNILNDAFLTMRNQNFSTIASVQYAKCMSKMARGSVHNVLCGYQNTNDATMSLLESFIGADLRKLTGITNKDELAEKYMELLEPNEYHTFFHISPRYRKLQRFTLDLD